MTPRNPQDTGDLVVRGRKPFAMIPTDLVRDPAISSSAVRLWTVLASYAYGSDVVTRPSRATLAQDCGYGSTRAVDLNLRQLQRTGWLSIESTQRADGGRGNNRYVLEWEPRVPAVIPEPVGADPASEATPATTHNGIAAGQPPAKISAPGSPTHEDVDKTAGQTPAKISAPGCRADTPPAKNIARGPAKIVAPLRERKQTKNQPPPAADLCRTAAAERLVAADPATTQETSVAAAADLAAAIRAALPSPLGGQLGAGVVRDRCVPLVAAGWTSDQIASATRARSWTGAGPGAVVRWVSDMASEKPPVAEILDREAALRRQLASRREHQAAAAAVATGPSPGRQEAMRLAAELAARSRGRGGTRADRARDVDTVPAASGLG
jgi:hypothetical protein